jgi:hypothetical protein
VEKYSMTLQDILQKLGIEYKSVGEHQHCTSGYLNIDCPYCTPKAEHYRFGIHLHHLYGNCWSCGHHSLAKALTEASGRRYREVKALLDGASPEGIPNEKKRGKLVLPNGLRELQEPHKKYLKSRGLDPEEMKKLWGLKGIGLAERLSWRIWIPIVFRGRVISWTTRSIGNSPERRYINAKPEEEEASAKDYLLGEDYARHSIVVTEGPFDVFRIGPGAVCTLGLAYSTAQVRKISRYAVRVILFDNEPEAQKRACALRDSLEALPGITYRVVLEAKDPGSAGDQELQELRRRFLS